MRLDVVLFFASISTVLVLGSPVSNVLVQTEERELENYKPYDFSDDSFSFWTSDKTESEKRSGTTFELTKDWQYAKSDRKGMITLTIQSSLDRMEARIGNIASKWKGPISYALVLKPKETIEDVKKVLKKMPEEVELYTSIHLVKSSKDWKYYPINYMRNVAQDLARTDYIYCMDIDEDVSGTENDHWKEIERSGFKDKRNVVFAMASFQWNHERSIDANQITYSDVIHMLGDGEVELKHVYYPSAYALPGLELSEWITTNKARPLNKHFGFEPYLIAKKSEIGLFDTRFVGYKGNYVSLTSKLQIQGFQFVSLPHVFTFTDETMEESLEGHDEAWGAKQEDSVSEKPGGRIQDKYLYLGIMRRFAKKHNCLVGDENDWSCLSASTKCAAIDMDLCTKEALPSRSVVGPNSVKNTAPLKKGEEALLQMRYGWHNHKM